jgi:hypothetical protein
MEKDKDKDKETLQGVLQAIHDEMESLWEAYMDSVGHHLEALPNGQPFNMYWPITQDYFTIYNSNALLIGRIPDPDLRKLIVSSYSKARGLIDSYRLNNDLVQKFEYACLVWQETGNPVHQTTATARETALAQYAVKMKESHARIKEQVQHLLRALRKEGVLNKPQRKTVNV